MGSLFVVRMSGCRGGGGGGVGWWVGRFVSWDGREARGGDGVAIAVTCCGVLGPVPGWKICRMGFWVRRKHTTRGGRSICMSKWCSWRYEAGKGRTGSGHVLFLTEEHSVYLSDISHLEGWPCLMTDAERVKKGEANSVFRGLLCWDVGRIWGRGPFVTCGSRVKTNR